MSLAPREPSRERKLAMEARLQRHPWLSGGVLVGLVVALFILPLIWLDFITALSVQVCGAGFLFIFGRWFTTAFQSRPNRDQSESADESGAEPRDASEPPAPGEPPRA